jgi:hypothetical protein
MADQKWTVTDRLGYVMAEDLTEEQARAWVLGATAEHRNGGHTSPGYTAKPAAGVKTLDGGQR